MEYFLSKRQQYEDLRAQLDTDYKSFEPQYRDLNDYFLPTRGRFILSQDSNRGDRRNHKIYDPTGYLSARTLASGMQAGVTSPARPWKRLTTPDPELAEFGPVREWLDVVNQRMSTYFLRSNLYNVLPTAYGDLGVFGTAAIFMDKDAENVSNFMSYPIGSFRIAKDFRGRVNVFHREFRMTVRQLIDHFGRQNEYGRPDWSIFSENVKKLYNRGQYETWVDVCHLIHPNPDYNPKKLEARFKKFKSCYYEKAAGDPKGKEDIFLRESGYDYFPVLVPRWQVTGMDVYGTDCPGMVAIGDNKQLQHGERRAAQAIDKMINPPMKASSGLKTTKASIVSGDITYLEDMNDRFEAAHEIRLDLSHLNAKQGEVRERIRRAFFEDLFLMLATSDRRDYTATEIMERKEEKLLALGPVLEQLNQDVLDPLIDNQFLLMQEAGLIPEAPQEIEGEQLKVEYLSIMAQAQKLVGIGGMDRLLGTLIQTAGVDPSVLKKFDTHQFIDEYADALGTPSRVIRSDEKVEELIKMEQEAAAKQAGLQNLTELSTAAKNLSQADMEKDSALSRLTSQANAGQLVPA